MERSMNHRQQPKPSAIIDATFVLSAASAGDLPRDGLAEIALVGRSNVGKSSLINALVRQRVARTSAAPGKTRLANVYRVTRSGGAPLYLLDLPGYGYARAPKGRGALSPEAARRAGQDEFEAIVRAVFARAPGDCCSSTRGTRASRPIARHGGGSARRPGVRPSWPRRLTNWDAANGSARGRHSNPFWKLPCCRSRRSRVKDWTNCGY
jgi:hypothetical protein